MPEISTTSLLAVFGRIGVLSFGGPAAQIGLMHKELVEDRDLLSEQEFLRALSLCMLLPGPEAMQLATYAGWRLRGVFGGLVAGLLFVLPGAAIILVLALIYAKFGSVPLVQGAFEGVKAAVIIIVLQALMKVSTKALRSPTAWFLAGGAFAALFLFDVPYPIIIGAAGAWGAIALVQTEAPPSEPVEQKHASVVPIIAFWGALWALPIVVLMLLGDEFLLQVSLFFSKLAVVTFGGAYAVLAYMTQTVVSDYGWITTAQMIDALGLAETTPGPLILVTQFVAMLAGFAEGGVALAVTAGAIALWVTFIPCFLWIFLAAPYLDAISGKPRIAAALSGITAAVVGVILNLALWFAIHVLFGTVGTWSHIAAPAPVLSSLSFSATLLTCLAVLLLLWFKRGIAETLCVMAVAGVCLSLL